MPLEAVALDLKLGESPKPKIVKFVIQLAGVEFLNHLHLQAQAFLLRTIFCFVAQLLKVAARLAITFWMPLALRRTLLSKYLFFVKRLKSLQLWLVSEVLSAS
jgi:hypothetical protein